jgi:putative endonuclease
MRVRVIARSEATWQSRGMERQYYIYILTNNTNRVLYTGVTNDLKKRIFEHKSKLTGGFTKSYNVDKLVYYEIVEDVYSAISREKQIKSWKRKNKLDLIQKSNPQWQDLFEQL